LKKKTRKTDTVGGVCWAKKMFHKIKILFIRIVTVSIVFYVLWLVVNKVSPTINPPKTSQESIERDYRGAIKIDMKQETFK